MAVGAGGRAEVLVDNLPEKKCRTALPERQTVPRSRDQQKNRGAGKRVQFSDKGKVVAQPEKDQKDQAWDCESDGAFR